jgi:hypothetical protein
MHFYRRFSQVNRWNLLDHIREQPIPRFVYDIARRQSTSTMSSQASYATTFSRLENAQGEQWYNRHREAVLNSTHTQIGLVVDKYHNARRKGGF